MGCILAMATVVIRVELMASSYDFVVQLMDVVLMNALLRVNAAVFPTNLNDDHELCEIPTKIVELIPKIGVLWKRKNNDFSKKKTKKSQIEMKIK